MRWEQAAVSIVAGIFVVRGLGYWSFVPIWDGRIYADCVVEAARALSPSLLNCAGHPTIGYTGLLALSQVGHPGHFAGMLLVNLALGATALVAFHAFLRILDPAPAHAAPRIAATAALSAHPVLLAGAVNISPDYGLAVFFILTLWSSAAGRIWTTGLIGSALVLSKEPGIGLYVITVVGQAALLGGPATWRERAHRLARFPLALPLVAIGSFLALRLSSGTLWGGASLRDVGAVVLSPGFDLEQRLFLVWIFVAGFQWVGSLAVFSGWGFLLSRSGARRSTRAMIYLMVLLLLGTYGLTRLTTFGNPRYFLALAPLLVGVTFQAVVAIPWKPHWATAFLGAWTLLLAAASLRTVDPAVRAIYGTFPFGKHEMLNTTSRTGECCGFGRDQLVYNLEFTRFHDLQNAFYTDLGDDHTTVLSAHPLADWLLAGPLGVDSRRTLGPGAEVELYPPEVILAVSPPPLRVLYLAFPNFPNASQGRELRTRYDIVGKRTYDVEGYQMDVFELRLRAP